MRGNRATPTLAALAFASGVAALLYQTVWVRWFRLLFGSTAYATSATLAAFFLGLGLGALWFGRRASRHRAPLRLYGLLEIGAAALALLVPVVLRAYEPLYAMLYADLQDDPRIFLAVKLLLAFVASVPPAALLGGTLPALAAAAVQDPGALGAAGNRLYALNTLGAAVGTALGALWLPEWIGVRGTYAAGIALGVACGVLAFWLRGAPAATANAPPRAPLRLRAIAFASGLAVLALEVLLVHALAQVLSSTIYSYGAVLLVVLLCGAAGAAAIAWSEGRFAAGPLLGVCALCQGAVLMLLPAAWVAATGDLHLWASGTLWNGLAFAGGVGIPALLLGCLVLPLTLRLAAGGAVGARLGGLLAANTFGGVLGALGASLVLLQWVGLWNAFGCIAAVYVGVALLASDTSRGAVVVLALAGIVGGLVTASPLAPWRLPLVATRSGERILEIVEGAHGVVAVVSDQGERLVKVDNHYVLAGSGAQRTERRAGHLPLLLHPDPRRVMFVGAATGGTASAATLHAVELIELVELVPEVLDVAARHFGDVTAHVHTDPRTRLVAEDGRNHLRAVRDRYDVVVADLFVPWRPGVGSLYTREHFEAVRARLSPGGLFCQWLPVYQLTQDDFETLSETFRAVFPNATLWRGDFFARRPRAALVGFRDALPTPHEIESRLATLRDGGNQDRWLTDITAFSMLYVGPLPTRPDRALNTDDRPGFEFRAGRSSPALRRDFLERGWPRMLNEITRAQARGPFDALPGPGARGGAALAQAVQAAVLRRGHAAAKARDAARRLVPAALLETPDPSVAEAWPWRSPD